MRQPPGEHLAPWRGSRALKLGRRDLLLFASVTGAAALVGGQIRPAAVFAADDAPFDAHVGLDPGHSHVDVGASGAGVGEFTHTLDVARRVEQLLASAGLLVRLSRTNDEPVSAMSHPNFIERTRIEQEARVAAVGKVRIYVSIHFNATADADPRQSGTETYYNPENAGEESNRLASALQKSVLGAIRETGYPAPDRGVKIDLEAGKPYGHFFSLRGGTPSALVEGLFLSNPKEAMLLLDESMRQAIAAGYAEGILNYFSGVPEPAPH
jgi:N-acetylmuramoyl-L-alanine amidase